MRLSHATQSIVGDTLSVWVRGVEDITIHVSTIIHRADTGDLRWGAA